MSRVALLVCNGSFKAALWLLQDLSQTCLPLDPKHPDL